MMRSPPRRPASRRARAHRACAERPPRRSAVGESPGILPRFATRFGYRGRMVMQSGDRRAVPRGLEQVVAKAARYIDEKCVWGLPHYTLDTRLRFSLVELGDLEL